jgi:hypothetical protein
MPSYFHQHRLKTIVPTPIREHRKLRRVHFAIELAHKWQINARQELDGRRHIRIMLPTLNLKVVNAILVHSLPDRRISMRWPEPSIETLSSHAQDQ